MCKIAVFNGINDNNSEKSWALVKAMAKTISGNPEKDGLGYAAITSDGSMFGERWRYNDDAFKENKSSTFEQAIVQDYLGFLDKEITYNRFGVVNEKDTRSVTLHSRFATSDKAF